MMSEVLDPLLALMVVDGYLTRDGDSFDYTDAGERESELIIAAWQRWFQAAVEADLGYAPGPELRTALRSVAQRLLDKDLREQGLTIG